MVGVCVINYGNISTRNIIECLRRVGIYNYRVIYPYGCVWEDTTHLILSGGPAHVYDTEREILPGWVLGNGYKIMGICYGMQLICYNLGSRIMNGDVQKSLSRIYEIGNGRMYSRWMNRTDYVLDVPGCFDVVSVCERGYVAGIESEDMICVQYHPESPRMRDLDIFRRFLGIK